MNAFLLTGLLLAAGSTGAQVLPPSGRAPPPEPDVVQSCRGCHGPRGAGVPAGDVPRIAGLPEYYISKQLRDYAGGTRRNPAMEEIARSLSAQDVAWLSAYFAQADAPAVAGGSVAAPGGSTGRGQLLVTVGSDELRLQACNNCHGPGGTGQPPAIPYLAGQGAAYMVGTLDAWRSGARRNDAGHQMAVIARALTPEAIVAVSRYYSGLPAAPPVAGAMVRSPNGGQDRRADELIVAAAARPATPARRVIAVDLAAADPVRGRAILTRNAHGCAGCHAIPGVRGANGVAGPPLRGMARRAFIAGQLPNRAGVLVAFLIDPPSLVPGTGMPGTDLARGDALDIAAYLYTLER